MRDQGWSVPAVVAAATAAQSVVVVVVVVADRLGSPTVGAVAVAGLLAIIIGGLVVAGFARMAE